MDKHLINNNYRFGKFSDNKLIVREILLNDKHSKVNLNELKHKQLNQFNKGYNNQLNLNNEIYEILNTNTNTNTYKSETLYSTSNNNNFKSFYGKIQNKYTKLSPLPTNNLNGNYIRNTDISSPASNYNAKSKLQCYNVLTLNMKNTLNTLDTKTNLTNPFINNKNCFKFSRNSKLDQINTSFKKKGTLDLNNSFYSIKSIERQNSKFEKKLRNVYSPLNRKDIIKSYDTNKQLRERIKRVIPIKNYTKIISPLRKELPILNFRLKK